MVLQVTPTQDPTSGLWDECYLSSCQSKPGQLWGAIPSNQVGVDAGAIAAVRSFGGRNIDGAWKGVKQFR